MFKNKYIIGIDGKSGTGKTSLSRYLENKYKDIEILNLDNFRNFSKKDFINITKGEKEIYIFLKKYYDIEGIKDKIKNTNSEIIIIEGCFVKTIEINIDLYKKIEEYNLYNEEMLTKLIKENKKITKDEAIAYLKLWDKVWFFYEKVYN